jgi:hypothetical protein
MKEFLEEYGIFIAIGIMVMLFGVSSLISSYGRTQQITALKDTLSSPHLSPEARKALEEQLIKIEKD